MDFIGANTARRVEGSKSGANLSRSTSSSSALSNSKATGNTTTTSSGRTGNMESLSITTATSYNDGGDDDCDDVLHRVNALQRAQEEALGAIGQIKTQIEGALLPLEAPWQPHFSEKYNRVYYYNADTGESVWDVPSNMTSNSSGSASGSASGGGSVNKGGQGSSSPDSSVGAPTSSANNNTGNATSTSSTSAASSSAPRIEDSLLKRGEEYARHREQLRLQREAEYKAEFPGTPKLTPLAQQKGTSELSIGDRSHVLLQKKREKEERLRQELQLESAKEVKAAPEITKKSKGMQRSVSDMLAWEQERRARREAMKIEADKAREAEVTSTPIVATRAVNEKLLQRRKGKEITSEGASVEERLLEYEEMRQHRLKKAAEKLASEARMNAKPQIIPYTPTSRRPTTAPSPSINSSINSTNSSTSNTTTSSTGIQQQQRTPVARFSYPNPTSTTPATTSTPTTISGTTTSSTYYPTEDPSVPLPRPRGYSDDVISTGGTSTSTSTTETPIYPSAIVGERLYRRGEAFKRHVEQRSDMLRAVTETYDSNGQPLFKPQINEMSQRLAARARRGGVPIEEALYEQGVIAEERLRKRQQKAREEEEEQKRRQFKMNANSERLLRERRADAGDGDVFQRLSKPKDSKPKSGSEIGTRGLERDDHGDGFEDEEVYLDAFEDLTASLRLDYRDNALSSFASPPVPSLSAGAVGVGSLDFRSIDDFLSPPPPAAPPSSSSSLTRHTVLGSSTRNHQASHNSYADEYSTDRYAPQEVYRVQKSGYCAYNNTHSVCDSAEYELDEFGRMVKL